MRFAHPFTMTSVLKAEFFLFLFPLTKRILLPALGFWLIIWPLSSSFTSPFHAIHLGYYTDLYVPFSIHPVTACKHLLAFIMTLICYFGREKLTHIPYSSFNSQSLRPVNSNTEGYWEIYLTSQLSVADHVTPAFTHILDMICKHILKITFLNESDLFFWLSYMAINIAT